MKKILVIIACVELLVLTSCANADGMISIYEQAIEDVQQCESKAEVENLTYRVKERLLDYSKRPGGDRKMGADDTERVMEAQDRYMRAVEARARQVPEY